MTSLQKFLSKNNQIMWHRVQCIEEKSLGDINMGLWLYHTRINSLTHTIFLSITLVHLSHKKSQIKKIVQFITQAFFWICVIHSKTNMCYKVHDKEAHWRSFLWGRSRLRSRFTSLFFSAQLLGFLLHPSYFLYLIWVLTRLCISLLFLLHIQEYLKYKYFLTTFSY